MAKYRYNYNIYVMHDGEVSERYERITEEEAIKILEGLKTSLSRTGFKYDIDITRSYERYFITIHNIRKGVAV